MPLVDTDCVIDYLKGKEKAVKVLQSLFDEGLYISVISLAEIYEGVVEATNKEKTIRHSPTS